jgi:hypothetical protein
MFDVLADFEWVRDGKGYRVVPFKSLDPGRKWSKGSLDPNWMVPNGSQADAIRYRPFARGGDLCTAFASVRSPPELLRFTNAHGLLTWCRPFTGDPNLAGFPAGEPVPLGLVEAEMFRELLRLQTLANPGRMAAHFETKIAGFVRGGQVGTVEIVPDPERGIRLKVRPPTLLGAMWYQLALKLSGATLRQCRLCHEVFEAGRGTGMRADAQFCCNEHKVEFFNRNRAKRSRRSALTRR